MDLIETAGRLGREAGDLAFAAPVAFVYNPLRYAWTTHEAYLRRFGGGRREVVMLGMNPGPWGMAQTGVPFGEVAAVRDWMGIEGPVEKPVPEHPRRPVEGFACRRSEVSGRRVWGWARELFGTPERFFSRFFVLNYCPLLFLEEGGRNLTPDRLPAGERAPLVEACDRALVASVERLQPALVVGMGRFARTRAEAALAGTGVRVGEVLHPSPASPAANRGWGAQAAAQLRALGVRLPGGGEA